MESDGLIETCTTIDGEIRPISNRTGFGNAEIDINMAGGAMARDERDTEVTPLLFDGRKPSFAERDDVEGDNSGESSTGPAVWPGLKDFEGLPWHKRPSVYWMLAPFLLFTLAYGGTFVPKINLITDLICAEYMQGKHVPADMGGLPVVPGESNEQCRIPQVQSRVAIFALIRDLLGGLLAAIVAPKLGSLSDRYGRTKVIAVTTLGMLVGDIIFIVVATYPDTFPVYWLIVGYALDGLSGTFIAGMAVAHAYATDCTPPAKRNTVFGYFHGCLFTGIAVGPILAALVIKKTHYLLSIFYIALGAHIIFLFCLLFIIPESLSKRRQRIARANHSKLDELPRDTRPTWSSRLRHLNVLAPLKILWPTSEGSSSALRRNLVLLASVDTVMFGVAMGSMTVLIMYTRFQFDWLTYESSVFTSIANISRVTGLVVILPVVTRVFRGKANEKDPQPQRGCDKVDLGIIRTAVFFELLGFLGYTLSRTGTLFTLSGVVAALGGIGPPTLQSALTKHVPSDRTGQVLGASGTLHALARVVAPTVFNAIYAGTVGRFTQAVFMCLTVCFGAACVLSWFIKDRIYWEDKAAPVPGVHDGEVDGEVGRS